MILGHIFGGNGGWLVVTTRGVFHRIGAPAWRISICDMHFCFLFPFFSSKAQGVQRFVGDGEALEERGWVATSDFLAADLDPSMREMMMVRRRE